MEQINEKESHDCRIPRIAPVVYALLKDGKFMAMRVEGSTESVVPVFPGDAHARDFLAFNELRGIKVASVGLIELFTSCAAAGLLIHPIGFSKDYAQTWRER